MLGKIVGGGCRLRMAAGDIMKKIMPAGPVFQAGTLPGNPLAMAAGLATCRVRSAPMGSEAGRALKQVNGNAQDSRPWVCRACSVSAACGPSSIPPYRLRQRQRATLPSSADSGDDGPTFRAANSRPRF